MTLPTIDYEAPVFDAEIRLLERYGWEISEDQRYARLYSEEWSSIQAALYSMNCWIEDCAS
jgi:hypothetical protein